MPDKKRTTKRRASIPDLHGVSGCLDAVWKPKRQPENQVV